MVLFERSNWLGSVLGHGSRFHRIAAVHQNYEELLARM